MNEETWFKLLVAAIGSFFSYCIYAVQRNNKKHDKHSNSICELNRKVAVTETQMAHILEKLEDVISLGKELKSNNNTILRALARGAKGKKE
jgi:t-SNARE complex subunit (syntaxin)